MRRELIRPLLMEYATSDEPRQFPTQRSPPTVLLTPQHQMVDTSEFLLCYRGPVVRFTVHSLPFRVIVSEVEDLLETQILPSCTFP